MALTITPLNTGSAHRLSGGTQPLAMQTFLVVADASWASGGEDFTPAMVRMSDVLSVFVGPVGGYVFAFDDTNSKLLAYRSGASGSPLAEAATADLSALVIRAMVIGVPLSTD